MTAGINPEPAKNNTISMLLFCRMQVHFMKGIQQWITCVQTFPQSPDVCLNHKILRPDHKKEERQRELEIIGIFRKMV